MDTSELGLVIIGWAMFGPLLVAASLSAWRSHRRKVRRLRAWDGVL